jgi:hypothetical protein
MRHGIVEQRCKSDCLGLTAVPEARIGAAEFFPVDPAVPYSVPDIGKTPFRILILGKLAAEVGAEVS